MSGASEGRVERPGRILAELSELGMSLARRTHERAMAAEVPEDAERLALAFHRLSRSVRQTLALEARLERDTRRDAEQADRRAEATRAHATSRRKAQVNAALSRLIWTEAERGEMGELLAGLMGALEEESLSDTFLDGPVEALIARLKVDLGLVANDGAFGDPNPSPLAEEGGLPRDGRIGGLTDPLVSAPDVRHRSG